MVEPLRPAKGGFQRPFGCARFIVDFLKGHGTDYGVTSIDPAIGATQNDILASYKLALHLDWVDEQLARENESRLRKRLPTMNEAEENGRREYWTGCNPWGRCRMRYHSFLVYFGLLKRLGWVEPAGQIEPSIAQEMMALEAEEEPRATGQPRIYYRITSAGKQANQEVVSNPLMALYPQFSPDYFVRKRALHHYVKC